jgi:hypothetical protein
METGDTAFLAVLVVGVLVVVVASYLTLLALGDVDSGPSGPPRFTPTPADPPPRTATPTVEPERNGSTTPERVPVAPQ